jgi:hypothetical protein
MQTITRTLVVGLAAAGFAALGDFPSALAVPVTPLVSGSTAFALTSGTVPVDISGEVWDAQEIFVSVENVVTNTAPPASGAETAKGAAEVTVDTTDINDSVVRGRSEVSTAAPSPPAPDQTQRMRNGSLASLSARLSAAGLAPEGTATVDLTLVVTGLLIYADPGGGATTAEDPFFQDLVSDMSANVSVLLAVAEPTADPTETIKILSLFSGSATLRAPMTAGNAPDLVLEADWASRPGDFKPMVCDASKVCTVGVAMTLLFEDVFKDLEPLGVGETFDIGLILLTNADAISDTGRRAASLFFDSASVTVALTAQVPEPGTLILLALGMLALAAAKRRGGTQRA